MRRLNVRRAQIDECIQSSMFALSRHPQNPQLEIGEVLLLQLVKQDADRLGKAHSRIDFALVFDRIERDWDGMISRLHWPTEGQVWPWIVYASATVPTIPFSLEDLDLSADYDGQVNARYILPLDEVKIRPFIQGALAKSPQENLQLVPVTQTVENFGAEKALSAIFHHDRILEVSAVGQIMETGPTYDRNSYLADSLKSYYQYRCQVGGHDFEPWYGVKSADGHHIQYLRHGGLDVSTNMVVLCPNHHRVIHETNAEFNPSSLEYRYPNGLRETLLLPAHLSAQRQGCS